MPATLDYNFCLCFLVLPCRVSPCKCTVSIQIKIQCDSCTDFLSSLCISISSATLFFKYFGLFLLNLVRPPSIAWYSLPMPSSRNCLQVESSGNLNSPLVLFLQGSQFCSAWCPKTEHCHFVYFIQCPSYSWWESKSPPIIPLFPEVEFHELLTYIRCIQPLLNFLKIQILCSFTISKLLDLLCSMALFIIFILFCFIFIFKSLAHIKNNSILNVFVGAYCWFTPVCPMGLLSVMAATPWWHLRIWQ